MADRSDGHKGRPPRQRRRRKTAQGSQALEAGAETPMAPSEAQARIAELEAELATAKATISALLDKIERMAGAPAHAAGEPGPGEVPLRSPIRTKKKSSEASDPPGTQSLDQIVRQRTRALAESEEQLRRKNLELERINEMKVEFISIATHELRTPLTSIVGYLDLLAEGSFGDLPRALERPLSSLRRNAHRLKRLVDEMLDVSRIDSGRVTLYRTLCNFGEVVREVVAELQPQAAIKRLELSAHVEGPPEIYADTKKIRQMASKLIANVIRNSPEGGIITATVDTAPRERFAGEWARLRVKGTGISIPNHMQGLIFEPFSAMQTARHHTSSGPDSAGLGLYIARGLIDLHGGLISVESSEDAYTEFTVLLPISEPTTVSQTA